MKKQLFHHYSTLCTIIVLSVLLNFMACSDSENPTEQQTGTVNGTLNLPEDATGKTWAVIFDNNIDGDDGFIKLGLGTCPSGLEVQYSVSDVPTGSYFLYAIVFVVGDINEGPDFGDFIGIYGGEYPDDAPASPNAPVTSGTNTYDIDLVEMID